MVALFLDYQGPEMDTNIERGVVVYTACGWETGLSDKGGVLVIMDKDFHISEIIGQLFDNIWKSGSWSFTLYPTKIDAIIIVISTNIIDTNVGKYLIQHNPINTSVLYIPQNSQKYATPTR